MRGDQVLVLRGLGQGNANTRLYKLSILIFEVGWIRSLRVICYMLINPLCEDRLKGRSVLIEDAVEGRGGNEPSSSKAGELLRLVSLGDTGFLHFWSRPVRNSYRAPLNSTPACGAQATRVPAVTGVPTNAWTAAQLAGFSYPQMAKACRAVLPLGL